MNRFESNVQYIKYLVNKEVVRRFFADEILNTSDAIREMSEVIIPGPKALFRCCIYRERHIVERRIELVLAPRSDNRIINVVNSACDECPVDRFVVTDVCRGCLSHKCLEVCPRNAIHIVQHRAYINQNLCIECGRCKPACPFNAISDVKRPCLRACPVDAVEMSDEKKAIIDHEKCISCGACVYHCPFGAIVDRSFVLDVLNLIKSSWNHLNYKVVAIVAPSIASQFPAAKMGQVFSAIKEIGFYDVYEAAIGGDMVAVAEAREFAHTVGELGWKTTSCCPSFVEYVKHNHPEFMPHVSTTVSPMIALARLIKQQSPRTKVIFIGPCTSKKVEIREDDLEGVVDYVLTFGELNAIFDAKEFVLTDFEESKAGSPSYYGRVFGRSGGVMESVLKVAEVENLGVEIKPIRCNGIDECIKTMRLAAAGRLDANFIEGMACKNGCTGGAASLNHGEKGVHMLNMFGKEATTTNPLDVIAEYKMEEINMERDFSFLNITNESDPPVEGDSAE
ncbi:MAG: 4Fe-4S dicluster domain-containing protein [Bacillota bacterium]